MPDIVFRVDIWNIVINGWIFLYFFNFLVGSHNRFCCNSACLSAFRRESMNFLYREYTGTNASIIGFLALGGCAASLVLALYPFSREMRIGLAFAYLLLFFICAKIDEHFRKKQFSDLKQGVGQ
ncbi:hypothetical protein [Methanosarcina acetivorans]|nr:hypothetical protein [Methanosarcina acetivorans]